MGSKQKDGIQLERSFLLRLPEPQAEMVRKTLHAGFVKDYLSIEFQADNRHATVRVGKSCLSGKLMDLPSIVESFKTVDKKSFYKTADICQMLVCTAESDDVDVEETSEQTTHKKDKKFIFNHGVTPPLKNVRKRRFRKTARKKHQECPEVEKELKRLLRADVQAENVTFEVLADEEKNDERPSLMSSPLANDHHGDEVDHLAFLQEPMSDEDDELDVENIQKDKSSSHSQLSDVAVEQSPNNSLFKEEEKTQSINKTSQPVSSDVLDVCEELRQKIEAQKTRIENAENPFLKQRFQSTLEKLQQQLKEKESRD